MKKVLKTLTTFVIVVSALALILVIALINYPDMSLVVLDVIVGIYLIIQGIMLIVFGIRALIKRIPFEGILSGVLSLILGILFLESPAGFAEFVGIVLGIWLIVHCISNIRLAIITRGSGAPWVLLVIINVIGIIAGGSIIYSPIFSSLAFTMALGIILIVDSIINIVEMIVLKSYIKNVGDDIEELEEVIEQAVQGNQNTVEPVEATVIESETAEEAPVEEEPASDEETK